MEGTVLIILSALSMTLGAQLPSNQYLPQRTPVQGHLSLSNGAGRRESRVMDKNAAVLRLEQGFSEGGNGFHYAFETSNGIAAEESKSGAEVQGSYSYIGDDGTTYKIHFTSGEGGFVPSGDHIPTPPPVPQDILLALQKNAKDEAAGIFDDGLYHPDPQEGIKANGKAFNQQGGYQASRTSSFTSSASAKSSFGAKNHQASFHANSGYNY